MVVVLIVWPHISVLLHGVVWPVSVAAILFWKSVGWVNWLGLRCLVLCDWCKSNMAFAWVGVIRWVRVIGVCVRGKGGAQG